MKILSRYNITSVICSLLSILACYHFAGASQVTVQLPIEPGWSMVSLPVRPTVPFTAEDFVNLAQTQGIAVISVAEMRRGRWFVYRPGLPVSAFPLEAERGYLVYNNGPGGEMRLIGEDPFPEPSPTETPSHTPMPTNTATATAPPGSEDTCPGILADFGTRENPWRYNGSTAGLANDYQSIGLNALGNPYGINAPDVVFQLIVPKTVYDVRFSTCAVTGFDTVLYLRTDCEDLNTEIALNDDSLSCIPTLRSILDIPSLSPGIYWLILDGYSTQSGSYTLDISGYSAPQLTETPTNTVTPTNTPTVPPTPTQTPTPTITPTAGGVNLCPGFEANIGLPGEPWSVVGSTVGLGNFTRSPLIESLSSNRYFGQVSPEAIWELTLDQTWYEVEITTCSDLTGFDTVLYVRTDCADLNSQILLNDDTPLDCSGPFSTTSRVYLQVANPGTYYIYVEGYNGAVGQYELSISGLDTPPTATPVPTNTPTPSPTPTSNLSYIPRTPVRTIGAFGTADGQFNAVAGLAIAGDLLLVCDDRNNRVQAFDLNGVHQWTYRGNENGNPALANPYGITVDDEGFFWVAENNAWGVRRVTMDRQVETLYSPPGLQFPDEILFDENSDRLFVLDHSSGVRSFNLELTPRFQWGSIGAGGGNLNFLFPAGVAVLGDGNIVISDTGNDRLQVLSEDGHYVRTLGSSGSGEQNFNEPWHIRKDAYGKLFVADYFNGAVKVWWPDGRYVGRLTGFANPRSLAFDARGRLYVSDNFNSQIRVFE